MSFMAQYPFNDTSLPTGGAILKSSDGVDFKVYKNILALASPFFKDMFSLPQSTKDPSSASGEVDAKTDIVTQSDPSVVELDESSDTLDTLLHFLYPLPLPRLRGTLPSGVVSNSKAFMKDIKPVLAAAIKYDMPFVVRALCAKLIEAADKPLSDGCVADVTPALRVYALACRYRLKEEAYPSAHATLRGRVVGVFIGELRDISAAQYFRLIQFHTKVVDTVAPIISTSGLPSPYDALVKCPVCESSDGGDEYECATWWTDFVDRASPILHESPGSTEVYSAAFLRNMFTKASACYGKTGSNSAMSNCHDVHGKWQTMSQFIRDAVASAIARYDIDLSEI